MDKEMNELAEMMGLNSDGTPKKEPKEKESLEEFLARKPPVTVTPIAGRTRSRGKKRPALKKTPKKQNKI
jgi:hypothetical protein